MPPKKPTASSPGLIERTVVQRIAHAEKHGQGHGTAFLVHAACDSPVHEADKDPWMLALVLVTAIVYLYTRRWEWALLAFVVYYATETLLFHAIGIFSPYVKKHMHAYHSRTNEIVTDPFVFMLVLSTAVYVFDYSILATAVVPPTALRVLAVSLAALLSAFSRIYSFSLVLLLSTIWIVYFTQTSTAGALAQALVASGTALVIFAWFVRPINDHYVFNAIFASLQAAFFAAILTGFAINV